MEDRKEKLLSLGAAAVGLAILLPYAQPVPFLLCLVVLLLALVLAAGAATLASVLKPRDPYDLNGLRKIDDEARRREAYESVPRVEVDIVLCPICGEEYDPKYSSCPNCRRGSL